MLRNYYNKERRWPLAGATLILNEEAVSSKFINLSVIYISRVNS
jgi:hypothetical protein